MSHNICEKRLNDWHIIQHIIEKEYTRMDEFLIYLRFKLKLGRFDFGFIKKICVLDTQQDIICKKGDERY